MLEKEEIVNPDKYALEEPLIFKSIICDIKKNKEILEQLNDVKSKYIEEISKICYADKEDFNDISNFFVLFFVIYFFFFCVPRLHPAGISEKGRISGYDGKIKVIYITNRV